MKQQHCWVSEGRFADGSWQPLPFGPSSSLSRRFTIKLMLEYAERELGEVWRTKDGKIKRKDLRVKKYIRQN